MNQEKEVNREPADRRVRRQRPTLEELKEASEAFIERLREKLLRYG